MSVGRLLRNFASVTVLRLGTAALGFALFWLLSHRLSSAELGGFSVLMSTFFLLQQLPMMGMSFHLIREVAAHPERLPHELGASLVFSAPWGLVLAAGVATYGGVTASSALWIPYLLLALSMLPTAWTLVAESALIGRERMQPLTQANLVEAVWRLAGAWASVGMGWGLTGVFGAFLIGRIWTAAWYARLPELRGVVWPVQWQASWLSYLRECRPYLAVTLVSAMASRVDVLLLSHFRSLHDTGVYAAAAKLYEASQMASTLALVVVYPVLSRLFVSDRAMFAQLLDRCVRWALLLGVPLVMTGMALAPALVRLVYAPDLGESGPILQVLLLGAWLLAIDQLMSSTMLAAKAQHHDLRTMVAGLLTLCGLITLLLPLLGLAGVAWAVVGGLIVRLVLRIRWAAWYLHLPEMPRECSRAALAALAGVGAFMALRNASAPLAWAAGVAVHLVGAWGLGALSAAMLADARRWRAQLGKKAAA